MAACLQDYYFRWRVHLKSHHPRHHRLLLHHHYHHRHNLSLSIRQLNSDSWVQLTTFTDRMNVCYIKVKDRWRRGGSSGSLKQTKKWINRNGLEGWTIHSFIGLSNEISAKASVDSHLFVSCCCAAVTKAPQPQTFSSNANTMLSRPVLLMF